ncbi:MAG: single-stranded DNA-binding protein [Acholeplasmatales bacterium]
MNKVFLVGRITRDPELKYTTSNVAVVSFSVAINRTYQNAQGEYDADFINCVAWRFQAENLARFVKKGQQIGIDGRLQTRTYETPTGETRYITEVVCDNIQFLEPKGTTSATAEPTFEEEDPLLESSMDIASEDDLPF